MVCGWLERIGCGENGRLGRFCVFYFVVGVFVYKYV